MTEVINYYEWTEKDQARYSAYEKFFEGKFLEEDLMDIDDLCPCGCFIGRSGWRLDDCAIEYAVDQEILDRKVREEMERLGWKFKDEDEECRGNMEDRYFC